MNSDRSSTKTIRKVCRAHDAANPGAASSREGSITRRSLRRVTFQTQAGKKEDNLFYGYANDSIVQECRAY